VVEVAEVEVAEASDKPIRGRCKVRIPARAVKLGRQARCLLHVDWYAGPTHRSFRRT
jgi:hypothetical protein